MNGPTRYAAEGALVADRLGIPHPVWCKRDECDLGVLPDEPGTAFIWHTGVVLRTDELLGVELAQADLVTLDGRHLERHAARVSVYLPEDGSALTAEQAGRLAGALSVAHVLAGDLPAFERGQR